MRWFENDSYFRIRKDTARKYHKSGQKVFILPCKVRLGNAWISPYELPLSEDFDIIIDRYEKSSACISETGMYCAFYAERK